MAWVKHLNDPSRAGTELDVCRILHLCEKHHSLETWRSPVLFQHDLTLVQTKALIFFLGKCREEEMASSKQGSWILKKQWQRTLMPFFASELFLEMQWSEDQKSLPTSFFISLLLWHNLYLNAWPYHKC